MMLYTLLVMSSIGYNAGVVTSFDVATKDACVRAAEQLARVWDAPSRPHFRCVDKLHGGVIIVAPSGR